MLLRLLVRGLAVVLGLAVWGCREDRKTEEAEEEVKKPWFKVDSIPPYCPATPFVFPVFIHDNYKTVGSKKIIPVHASWMSSSDYGLLYIGRNADTIYTGNYHFDEHTFYHENLGDQRELYSIPNPLSISLKVDTSTIIPYESSRKDTLIKMHPVYIINKHFSPVEIAGSISIPLVLEAQTSNREWKPIQRYYGYTCGTGGTRFTLLFPGEIAVTTVMIFSGPLKTKMRLRFDIPYYTVVSNEFDGSIEVSQFSDPY